MKRVRETESSRPPDYKTIYSIGLKSFAIYDCLIASRERDKKSWHPSDHGTWMDFGSYGVGS